MTHARLAASLRDFSQLSAARRRPAIRPAAHRLAAPLPYKEEEEEEKHVLIIIIFFWDAVYTLSCMNNNVYTQHISLEIHLINWQPMQPSVLPLVIGYPLTRTPKSCWAFLILKYRI
jgi:hypothetical protein